MRRYQAYLAATALQLVSPAAAQDKIDRFMAEQMRAGAIPGAAVAVIDHGRVRKLTAYGIANLEWSAPVALDTRFQLASATKIFTGVLLMRLVEQGKVKLDDPLTRWFPEAPRTWSGITVRQLADHTSGLADKFDGPRPQTVAGIVAEAMRAPLAYTPGTESRYGFTDFTVLRAILEKASGLAYPDLLATEITGPLAMRSTEFAHASDDGMVRTGKVLPHRASTYGWRDGELTTSDFFFAPQGYGAGGLYSSIRDLATFFAALDAGKVLTRTSLLTLERPATLPAGKVSEFGVGWVSRTHNGLPVVGHSGGPALADIARIEDRQLTVIALTNQQVFFPILADKMLDSVLPVDPGPTLVDPRPADGAHLRALLDAAGKGQPVAEYFAPDGKGSEEALTSLMTRALFRATGPVQSIAFVGGTAQQRRYKVQFARHSMIWVVTPTGERRFSKVAPE